MQESRFRLLFATALQKTLTFHNVIILIRPVLNKDQNHYYNNT